MAKGLEPDFILWAVGGTRYPERRPRIPLLSVADTDYQRARVVESISSMPEFHGDPFNLLPVRRERPLLSTCSHSSMAGGNGNCCRENTCTAFFLRSELSVTVFLTIVT